MKKIIFGILSILLGFSAFCSADYVSPVVMTATGGKIYTNYGYNYYGTYYSSSRYCGKSQIFGVGSYSDYINGVFDFTGLVDNTLTYGDTGVYLIGFNNGYYLTGGLIYSPFFVGSIYGEGLSCNTRAYPAFSDNSYFSIGFDSSNSLHTILFNPKIGGCQNGCSYVGGNYSIPLYNTDVLLSNTSYTTGLFNNFIYIDYTNNLYFYFDDNKIYSKWGSFTDVPYSSEGAFRKKFLINDSFNYSTIYTKSGEIGFYSVNDDGVVGVGGDFPSLTINPSYGYFLFHIFDYSSGFLSSTNSTFVLAMTSSGVIYNAYSVFSNNIDELLSLEPVRKGYFVGDFNTFVNSNGQYFEIYGSYINGVTFRVYPQKSNVKYTNYSFTFQEDSNIPTIDLSGYDLSLTFHQAQNILDTLCNSSLVKPAFCNRIDQVSTGVDGFWDLDGSGNLVYTLINTDPNNLGWAQITPDGSGGFNIMCSDEDGFGCPVLTNNGSEFLSDYGSGVLLDTGYYENFFQKTGYLFKCPYEYVFFDTGSYLKILNKFNDISSSIGFDFMLPINCTISAFIHGKQFKFLSSVNLGLNPLMGHIQGPDDPRVYLYRFFDFLLAFALLCFLLKLYHLIN